MIKPLELLIGLRYTRAKRRNNFISFISLISMFGIILGVWALIVVLSIMNGFHQDLKDRILFVVSHVTVSSYSEGLTDWQTLANQVSQHEHVVAEAPYIIGQGMLTNRGQVNGALIRGIDPEYEVSVSRILEPQNIKAGKVDSLQAGDFNIILGDTLARILGVGVGDKVTLIAPKGKVSPAGLIPRLKRFTVSGIFEINMHEYDSGIALIHIDDAARLFATKGAVSGLRLKLDDVELSRRVRYDLNKQLPGLNVTDWTMRHRNFFRALEIEKRVVFIVLLLIVAVAAFNIVSTLVMIVTDKLADVAILRTLGLSPRSVMAIFMIQGTIIGVVGTLVGALLGVITALNVETLIPWIEGIFNTQLFPEDIYVISDFPAQMRGYDVMRIIIASLGMSILATLYPAWNASRVQPAEALRYD